MYQVNVPESLVPQIVAAAGKSNQSVDDFVAESLRLRLEDEVQSYDHLFTPERLADLDSIVADLEAGAKTYTLEEARLHVRETRERWLPAERILPTG